MLIENIPKQLQIIQKMHKIWGHSVRQNQKKGYELIEKHKFNWCSEKFEKRCTYDVKQCKNKISSDTNLRMSVIMFTTSAH